MSKRLNDELEARCVASAREIFKILGNHADKLLMGDNVDRDKEVKVMVEITDEIAKVLAKHEVRPSEWHRIQQYMVQPVSEYEWRVQEYLQGFKDLILSNTIGKNIYDITITDLQNKVVEMYKKEPGEVFKDKDKEVEEAQEAEKSTEENIAPEENK